MAVLSVSPVTTTTQHVPQLAALPDLLTVREVAAVLRVSRTTVFRWRRQGLLPAEATIPGRPRWHRADIAKWLEERRD